MSNNIEYKKDPHNGKVIAGVILLVVGAALLSRQLDVFFLPRWLFSWPMVLIIPGLYIGAKSNFRKPTWFILVLLGLAFMAMDTFDASSGVIWPITFIAFGIWMIIRRTHKDKADPWKTTEDGFKEAFGYTTADDPITEHTVKNEPAAASNPVNEPQQPPFHVYNDDKLDVVAVFGGVDRVILSKNFKGGEIVNIFGGTEIDFTKADISGQVIVEVTQVFGGTKLIVPPHWHVISDIASVFAGIDDKRMRTAHHINSDKILVIKGISIFAGINIHSY
ncbi:MAG: hypothetical protein EOP47_15085 [Sphingobacteriaceae bacterium]|nr:MAG: hypothetical protein EOP47_15085 [Sphingobacteriaceae bacterium]